MSVAVGSLQAAVLARSSRSGDISNCSYRLSFLPLTYLHLSLAKHIFYRRKLPKTSAKTECSVDRQVVPYDHWRGRCGVYIDCEQNGDTSKHSPGRVL